jgi:protein-S-isoprenylcysteine O-methyltransferase Ste14
MNLQVAASSILILLAVFIYGLAHSLLASLWAKEQTRHWFGRLADHWYRILYNLIAVASFLPVFGLLVLLPDRGFYRIPFPWALITLFFQGLAVFILLAGLLQTGIWSFLGFQQLVTLEGGNPPRLVVSGLYRWVRHPLYTAGLLIIWLSPRMTYNILALNAGLTLYIIIGAFFEERKLVREYGEAYIRYRQSTPMFIPWKICSASPLAA